MNNMATKDNMLTPDDESMDLNIPVRSSPDEFDLAGGEANDNTYLNGITQLAVYKAAYREPTVVVGISGTCNTSRKSLESWFHFCQSV